MLLLIKYVWRWITALVKEVTLSLIVSHVLTPRTLSPSLMLISLLVLLIFIMQTFDDRETIRDQLETYVLQVKRNASFSTCEDVQSLAIKMVQTEKHLVFPLVYKLIELALILPVSTASVERAFSAMKLIKSNLRNKINDVWFNDDDMLHR